MMKYTGIFSPPGHPVTETSYLDLKSAISGIIETIQVHPEILVGNEDLAVITDTHSAESIIGLFRDGKDFVLAREDGTEKYEDELNELVTVANVNSSLQVFHRWKALDAR